MGANKFATMLHRNTNKTTMILIYAVLEWTLIVLLLLNSLFSYFIIKFAQYFGLKPPCLWCTRVDHIFEPGKNKNMHRDLLCEAHAKEISKLGYCSNHQKLAESEDMCEDCLSSKPEFHEVSKKFTFFGMIQTDGEKVLENGHVSFNCSCCNVTLDNMYSHIVIKPTWDVLEHAKNGKFITEAGEADHIEEGHDSDFGRSDFTTDACEVEHCFENKDENVMISDVNGDINVREKEENVDGFVSSASISELKELKDNEVEKVDVVLGEEKEEIVEGKPDMTMKDEAIQVSLGEDVSLEILSQHLEFFIDCSGHRLVPVELIDSATEDDQCRNTAKEENQVSSDERGYNSGLEVHEKAKIEVDCRGIEENAEHSAHTNDESRFVGFESMEIEEDENSLVFHANEYSAREVTITQMAQTPSQDIGNVQAVEAAEEEDKHSDAHPVCDDIAQIPANETESEVSIGTEIPDLDTADDNQTKEAHFSHICTEEDSSISTVPDAADGHVSMQVQEQTIEFHTLSVEVNEHVMNNQSSFCLDLNEIEADKAPDTPTSTDSLHLLHKKLILLEKKDEDSLDGSVTSELEGGDGVVTNERLKSALRAERKALHALYAELEEERNASAIAANQTMAMINRLQEEKAAMQIEALQYQRMMDEQAEYDQEAMQLLNELMVKREKEKEELEKELEVQRKKVLEYETKAKLRMLRKSRDGSARSGFSSPSCSNAEESDAASFDLNQEAKEEDAFYRHRECEDHNTPVNAVLNLEESVADFEEERLSILEQLKVLEVKLMTLEDEDLQHFEDIRPVELHQENGDYLDENGHLDGLENGHAIGFTKEMNGKHHPEKRSMGPKGKSLLPLFDAESDENGDSTLDGNENGVDSNGMHESSIPKFELENKRLVIEEELDHLYERLQALEEDREFLKHCISSLNKGDKGMHILHEILQHLRDLRNVELRVRNLSDGPVL